MLVVIGTDCIGSCKSNYHTITIMQPLEHLTFLQMVQTLTLLLINIEEPSMDLQLYLL